jgi:hypothetical protein
MTEEKNKAECCPEFQPEPWDGRLHVWEKKKFIKDRVCTFYYIPLNFGSVVRRMTAKVEKAGATVQDNIGLSDHTSKWNMDFCLAVDREVPGADNVEFTGKFLSKVYEGDFKETGTWCKDFEEYAAREGHDILKLYMWYTTCPKCAKKYGKNYVVVIASVK